MMKLFAESN